MRAHVALLLITACGPASALPWRFEPSPDARSFVAARLAPEAVVTAEGVRSVRPDAPWLRLEGVAAAARLRGEGNVPGRTSDFSGRDVASWRPDVCRHEGVRVQDAWPGIDVVHHARGGDLEHDFVVAPGADPSVIRLRLERATQVEPLADGSVLARSGSEALTVHAPVAWQCGAAVEAAWRLEGRTLSLRLGPHDPSRELLVDPVLRWSTWLGGQANATVARSGLAVAADGDVVVLVMTPDMPATPGAWSNGPGRLVAARLSRDLSALRWATYLPTNSSLVHEPMLRLLPDGRILVASGQRAGNALVAGVPNAGGADPFLVILTEDGSNVDVATYAGTPQEDHFCDVAVTGSADVLVVAGVGAINADDWQVTRLAPDLTTVRWRRVLGSSSPETPSSVAWHPPTDDVVVAGFAAGSDFPTLNAWIPAPPPPLDPGCFARSAMARLHGGTGATVFATYVASSCDVNPGPVFADAAGDVVFVGATVSPFPTLNAWQPSLAGLSDALVVRLAPTGAPVFATYVGGSDFDWPDTAGLDPGGRVLFAGHAKSTDWPIVGAWGLTPAPTPTSSVSQPFLARLDVGGMIDLSATWGGGVSPISRIPGMSQHPTSAWSDGSDIVVGGQGFVTDLPVSSSAHLTTPPVEPGLAPAGSAFVTVITETVSSMGEPATAAHPLRLGQQGPELVLGWDETLGDRDARFGLYMGTIASLRTSARWDHRPLAPCSFAAPPVTIPMPDGDAYFLLTSVKGEEESSYGRDSFGRERPAGRARCR